MLLLNSIYMMKKSYQTRNRLYGQLAKYVKQLDGFTAKRWSRTVVEVMDYNSKVLHIAIPKVSITGEQKFAFDAVKLYAKERGIKIIVSVVTNK